MRDTETASSPTSVTTRPASRRPAPPAASATVPVPWCRGHAALDGAAPEAVMAGIRDILRDGDRHSRRDRLRRRLHPKRRLHPGLPGKA